MHVDVRPLLLRHCTMCHGALKQEGGLRLDTGDLIRQGADSGPVIVPGKSDESLLLAAVTRAENRMPADAEPLSEADTALLRRWIDRGAEAPRGEPTPADPRQHWAFQPPVRPAIPASGQAATMANPDRRVSCASSRGQSDHGQRACR